MLARQSCQEYRIGLSTVVVRFGSILTSESAIIVSSDDSALTMRGGVSRAILEAAGAGIRDEARKNVGRLAPGDVVLTSAGKLKARYILHAVTRRVGNREPFSSDETRAIVGSIVARSLDIAASLDANQIAFPAIGTGFANQSATDVAIGLAEALGSQLRNATTAFVVELFIQPSDIPRDVSFLDFFLKFENEAKWPADVARNHAVALIHGIRTDAVWQDTVGEVLRRKDRSINPISLGYGYFDVVRFLLPLPWIRRRLSAKLAGELVRIANSAGTKRLSVIAHSFGAYLVANAILSESSLSIHCLILCGSVTPYAFDWSAVERQLAVIDEAQHPTMRAINDCGWRDVWPVLAQSLTWGYGATGRFGRKTGCIKDRFHDKAHSDFFDARFVEEYWAPAISDGHIARGLETRSKTSWALQMLTVIPIKYMLLAIMAAAIIAVLR